VPGQVPGTPAGWFPDPLGRYDHRWYNGTVWTADVSVDGQRYVDPMPVALPGQFVGPNGVPTAHQGWAAAPKPPSRTLALLALVFGLIGVATGWMPFLFVIGALAGIAALVLGLVARSRVRSGRATGGKMAIAGIALGPLAIGLCVVGAILTGMFVRELTRFTEPGPVDAEITSCSADGPAVRAAGTIENLDDEAHDYTIVLEVYDGRDLVDRVDVAVEDVAPGEVRDWDRTIVTRGDTPDEPTCEIFAVNGPFPFGLNPNP